MRANCSPAEPHAADPGFFVDLIEQAADAIVSIDPAGVLQSWNGAAEKL